MLSFNGYSLEPIQPQDAWNLCHFIVANEDRLKRYFPKTLEQNLTPDLSKFFVQKKVKQFNLKEELLFTIKENKSGELVGLVYIKELNWNKKQGEFAYCIGYPYERKGIITKAISTLSEYAFINLGLETLQIIVHKDNIASVKIAEKCHFIWKRTLNNAFTPPGENPLNMELYELSRRDLSGFENLTGLNRSHKINK
ncbi:GNAT family N-acetyltransferase [Flavivirga sp. 57AJ16]|uniref:GNAT family N-acetyltransferase n=1 Tax=Flavivirga sp. 57AJ16 TaxID=3025307 RepID=UPI002366882B|nr:GNAT family N-acetyltransferase [Flavivirga sp. 57AJ16]MDD7887201.1 GNAT family N-acetyltransferase [Flavivirga sp. 57AJ16]